MAILDLMISYLTHIPMRLPFYSRECVEKDSKAPPYLKVLLLGCFIMISLIAGCRGCKKTTEPSNGNEWDPRNISRNEKHSVCPFLAVDGNENVHIVWADSTPGNWEIFHSQKTPEGEWSAAENITKTPERSITPAIAVDGSGNLHLVWVEGPFPEQRIYYSMKPVDGEWTNPVRISDDWGDIPCIGVDDAGDVHLIWMDGYYRRKSGGVWSSIETIPSPTHVIYNPAMAVTDVDVHVAFEPGYDPSEVYHIMKLAGGSWMEAVNVSESTENSWVSAVAVDGDGNAYVSWTEMETDKVYFRIRSSDGVWTAKDSIPGIEGDPWMSEIATDGGTIYFVWSGGVGYYDIYYRARGPTGVWSDMMNLSNTSDDSLVRSIVLGKDNLHVTWSDKTPGNWEIFYVTVAKN